MGAPPLATTINSQDDRGNEYLPSPSQIYILLSSLSISLSSIAMATKMTKTSAFLIILILASQSLVLEGRPLIKGKTKTCRNCLLQSETVAKGMVQGPMAPSPQMHRERALIVISDDVRPTTPGHSPGVGH